MSTITAPLSFTNSSGEIGKTVSNVPPAPHKKSYFSKSSSQKITHSSKCPNGGMPPIR